VITSAFSLLQQLLCSPMNIRFLLPIYLLSCSRIVVYYYQPVVFILSHNIIYTLNHRCLGSYVLCLGSLYFSPVSNLAISTTQSHSARPTLIQLILARICFCQETFETTGAIDASRSFLITTQGETRPRPIRPSS
jgi:hypothetical protein